jgi:hypothetical protein
MREREAILRDAAKRPLLRMRAGNPGKNDEFLHNGSRRLGGVAACGEALMTTIHTEMNSLSPSEHQVQLRRAVIASTIGTAIEWYDFFLYSTVTGLVFAKLFFRIRTPGSARWRPSPSTPSASSRARWEPPFSATTATALAASRR